MDQTTGDFYTTTLLQNGAKGPVYRFEANGDLAGELTGTPAHPYGVAVDNSPGATASYVYVADTGSGIVQQFDAAEPPEATAVTITEGSLPEDGAAQGGGLPPVVNPGSFAPRAPTVGATGNVFVVDLRARAIDEFDATGNFVAQLLAGEISLTGATRGLAADGAGDLYLANESAPKGSRFRTPSSAEGAGLFEIDAATGECVQAGCKPIDPEPIKGVAFDAAAGTIFTAAVIDKEREEGKFTEYDAATGKLLGATLGLRSPHGIGVNEATGEVIVADQLPYLEGTVQIFGPALEVPGVKALPPEAVGDGSATLRGEINPEEGPPATCFFQYVDQEGYEAHGFEGAAQAPCPEGPFTGNEWHAVEAHLEGLRGGTTYHQRIVGADEYGTNPGTDIPFTTEGPTVGAVGVMAVGESAATLAAWIYPRGSAATTYRFQYETLARYDANPAGERFAGASEVPVGGGTIAATGSKAVFARLEGLVPGSAYRVRVIAASLGGPHPGRTEGPASGFATYAPSASTLPDGRRWEQVSPLEKNGGNAEGELNVVHASPDGERITYFSSAGFPLGEGAQQYPSYLSTRAADGSGWSTQGLLPPAAWGPRAEVLGFSADLGEAYDFAAQPFEGARLLRRTAAGAIGAVGQEKTSPPTSAFAFAAASENGVALLETKRGGLLPGDREGAQNVYVYAAAERRLAVAGVMNDGSVPAGGAMAGPYDWWNKDDPSEPGGALDRYFTQEERAISADGRAAFFTAGGTGQLYVRVNPLAAQSAMSGGRCTEGARACTIRVSAPAGGVADPGTPAAFVGASANGSVVYFLDKGRLTEGSTAGPGYDLYRRDLQTGALVDLTVDHESRGARVEGMVGIGEGGGIAYFVASGALAEGAERAPFGETNLYVLEGKKITFLARLGAGEQADGLNWLPRSATTLGNGEPFTRTSRVSPDGRTLLVRSTHRLTSYDNHIQPELYLHRAGQGLSCISCLPTGEAPSGPSGVQEIPYNTFRLRRNFSFTTHNLSADGRRVIFDSADRLVSADHNDVNDVYEWEANGKGSCAEEAVAGGCLFLLSSGAAEAEPSYFADADEEGENVFVFTYQRLVAQDRDQLVDVYDARVGGGIPAQEATPEQPCQGEGGCLPPPPPAPQGASPASPAANGHNVTPVTPCGKGKVRRHGHCVRRAHKRHHKRHGRHHRRGRHHKARHGGKGKARRHNGKGTHRRRPGHREGKGGRR